MGVYSRALPMVLEQANIKLQEVHTAQYHAVLLFRYIAGLWAGDKRGDKREDQIIHPHQQAAT